MTDKENKLFTYDLDEPFDIQSVVDVNVQGELTHNGVPVEECTECGEELEGDMMIPEGQGPMHTDCWVDWMEDQ